MLWAQCSEKANELNETLNREKIKIITYLGPNPVRHHWATYISPLTKLCIFGVHELEVAQQLIAARALSICFKSSN